MSPVLDTDHHHLSHIDWMEQNHCLQTDCKRDLCRNTMQGIISDAVPTLQRISGSTNSVFSFVVPWKGCSGREVSELFLNDLQPCTHYLYTTDFCKRTNSSKLCWSYKPFSRKEDQKCTILECRRTMTLREYMHDTELLVANSHQTAVWQKNYTPTQENCTKINILRFCM